MADLLEPKELTVTDQSGKTRSYLLSKFTALEGREIIAKYPLSSVPKLGDYAVNEEVMLKLMGFVAVQTGDVTIRLTTRALVNNHVPDWETLARIEVAMIEYNCSFFLREKISTFFGNIAQTIPQKITEILTASLGQSLQTGKPPSTN